MGKSKTTNIIAENELDVYVQLEDLVDFVRILEIK